MNKELSDAVWSVIGQKALDHEAGGYTPTFNDLPMFLFAIAVDLKRLSDQNEPKIEYAVKTNKAKSTRKSK